MKYLAVFSIVSSLFLFANMASATELLTADSQGRLVQAKQDEATSETSIRIHQHNTVIAERVLFSTLDLTISHLNVNTQDEVLLTGTYRGTLYTRGDTPLETAVIDGGCTGLRLFFYTVSVDGRHILTTMPANEGRPLGVTVNGWGEFEILMGVGRRLTRWIMNGTGDVLEIVALADRPTRPGRDGAQQLEGDWERVEPETGVAITETDAVDPPDDGYEDPNG